MTASSIPSGTQFKMMDTPRRLALQNDKKNFESQEMMVVYALLQWVPKKITLLFSSMTHTPLHTHKSIHRPQQPSSSPSRKHYRKFRPISQPSTSVVLGPLPNNSKLLLARATTSPSPSSPSSSSLPTSLSPIVLTIWTMSSDFATRLTRSLSSDSRS